MRAVVLKAFGEAHTALEFTPDHPKPERKPGEVLIDVKATSLNPGEWHTRKGDLPAFLFTLPQILGVDVAGVVLEADESSKFKPGDRVFGCTGQVLFDAWGTYAELCSARQDRLAHIPDGLSFEQAAALPVAALTAWQALAPDMPLAGKRVFVHGGAGGIGHLAVQIAKAQGAYVAASCSARNVQFVTQDLGADAAVDYTTTPVFTAPLAERYDVVVDLVGAEPASWGLLKPSGRMAAVSVDPLIEGRTGVWLLTVLMYNKFRLMLASALRLCPRYDSVMQGNDPNQGLVQVGELVATGKVRVHISGTVPLEKVADAHVEAEKRRTRGKVVIAVSP